jgi:hypothetical protein
VFSTANRSSNPAAFATPNDYQALPKKNTNLTSKQGNGFFFKYYRVTIELLITFLYSSGHTRRRRRRRR